MDDNGFHEDLQAEFEKLRGIELDIRINGLVAWMVLAQLQLASRHPFNDRQSLGYAVQFARALEREIAPAGPLARLAEMGWNPAYDRTPKT